MESRSRPRAGSPCHLLPCHALARRLRRSSVLVPPITETIRGKRNFSCYGKPMREIDARDSADMRNPALRGPPEQRNCEAVSEQSAAEWRPHPPSQKETEAAAAWYYVSANQATPAPRGMLVSEGPLAVVARQESACGIAKRNSEGRSTDDEKSICSAMHLLSGISHCCCGPRTSRHGGRVA